jgi:hypothetical protein
MNLLAIAFLALFAQQSTSTSVQGTVVQLGTSQPVARATVELKGESERNSYTLLTGTDGKFEFRNLAAGQYQLKVFRVSYIDSRQRSLSITAGQSVKDMRIGIVQLGAISGRVYDSNGDPLTNVAVRALKYSYLYARKTLTPAAAVQTDDRGEYRLFWLTPGQYYVGAVPEGSLHDDGHQMSFFVGGQFIRIDTMGIPHTDRPPGKKTDEVYAPVFYPGTSDAQGAAAIDVHPGTDFGGVDFSLKRVPLRTVRGIVVDGTTGQAATRASRGTTPQVMLVPRGPSINGTIPSATTSDGTFEIKAVLPGSYFLIATYRNNTGQGSTTVMSGRVPVEVGNSDVGGVSVTLSPATELSGQVIVDGVRDDPDVRHPVVSLQNDLTGTATGNLSQFFADFSDNRAFVIHSLIDGEYRVSLTDLPAGAYLKSIRFGGGDAVSEGFHVDAGSNERLEIVLGVNPGTVDGVVVSKSGDVVGNAAVTLVPDAAHRQRTDLYRNAVTDEFGRFHLQNVAPGSYLAFAWEDIAEDFWRDPEFIRRNENSGKPVKVGERSRESVEVTASPPSF